MANLYITLDPSVITQKTVDGKDNFGISLSITGAHLESKDIKQPNDIPQNWLNADDIPQEQIIKETLYPWYWTAPKNIRVYWLGLDSINPDGTYKYKLLKKANGSPESEDLSLSDSSVDYENDRDKLIPYYENILKKNIFNVENNKKSINYKDINFQIITNETSILIHEEMPEDKPTGFLQSSIAGFSQQLSPLNEQLKLVFFANAEINVDNRVAFIAFPINNDDKNGWQVSGKEPAVYNDNFFSLKYTRTANTPAECIALSAATPIPTSAHLPKVPNPELRETNGNFIGYVNKNNLTITDAEDWRREFAKKVISFINTTELMSLYLLERISKIEAIKNNDFNTFKKLIPALNDFLLAAWRDNCYFMYLEKNADFLEGIEPGLKTEFKELLEKYNISSIQLSLDDWKVMLNEIIKESDFQIKTDYSAYTDNEWKSFDIDNFLKSWNKITGVYNDNDFIRKVLITQWYYSIDKLNATAGVKDKLKEHIKSKLQIDKIIHSYRYQKTDEYITAEFLKQTGPTAAVKEAKDKIIEAFKDYLGFRISSPQIMFYPQVFDPFATAGINEIKFNYSDFVNTKIEFDNSLVKRIESSAKESIEHVSQNTPPVHVQLKPSTLTSIDDDLSDEISGYIVIQNRSKDIHSVNFEDNWKHLNKTKISYKLSGESDFLHILDNIYIKPVFLPVQDDIIQKSVELKNEDISLVSGHDFFSDATGIKFEESIAIRYYYDGVDNQNNPYAFWYGYHYKFAAYLALNSGVLPVDIRSNESWTIPQSDVIKNDKVLNKNIRDYEHLRRVPIGKVRIETTRYNMTMPNLPKGLHLLTKELLGSEERLQQLNLKNIDSNDLPVALLHEHLDIKEQYEEREDKMNVSDEIQLTLRPPSTHFWNWYAWVAGAKDIDETGKMKSNNDEVSKDEINKVLAIDLHHRNNTSKETSGIYYGLPDPAVINNKHIRFLIEANIIYNQDPAIVTAKPVIKEYTIKNESFVEKDTLKLKDTNINFKVILTSKEERGSVNDILPANIDGDIKLLEGEVLQLGISCLIEKKHFENSNEIKFHSFMNETLDEYVDEKGKAYYKTKPSNYFFEGAAKFDLQEKDIWDALKIESKDDAIALQLHMKPRLSRQLALVSNIQVRHQVWNWNGRLDKSNQLLGSFKELKDRSPGIDINDILDPTDVKKTTDAMKWEAWAFSDRPDYSALVDKQANLIVVKDFDKVEAQQIFRDNRPGNKKALYYRFAVTLYSRYCLLKGYEDSLIDAALDKNVVSAYKWKRFIKKSTVDEKLSKPSVRFILPLTKSVNETKSNKDNIGAASLLLVLDDSESNIGKDIEVCVKIMNHKGQNGNEFYLQTGNDPILTGIGLAKLDDSVKDKERFLLDSVIGPSGLTFDFAAQTPKINGSTYIINIPDLSKIVKKEPGCDNELKPWSLMQISVRRILRAALHEKPGIVDSFASEWSAPEWVQFLPDTNMFIPKQWRTDVLTKSLVELKFRNEKIDLTHSSLPVFDSSIEQNMKRYVVFSEIVKDIGDMPVEKYVATYEYGEDDFLTKNHLSIKSAIKDGYARIMLVREKQRKDLNPEEIKMQKDYGVFWNLFGKSVNEQVSFGDIQNDPIGALPLVSERIRVRILMEEESIKTKS